MKTIDKDKFLNDYEMVIKEREDLLSRKDNALAEERQKAENIVVANNYSDAVREVLVNEVLAEKEKEFDSSLLDSKIEFFETYIVDIDEVVEQDNSNDFID